MVSQARGLVIHTHAVLHAPVASPGVRDSAPLHAARAELHPGFACLGPSAHAIPRGPLDPSRDSLLLRRPPS